MTKTTKTCFPEHYTPTLWVVLSLIAYHHQLNKGPCYISTLFDLSLSERHYQMQPT